MLDKLFVSQIWQNVYFGNSLRAYVVTVAVFVAFMVLFKVFQSIFLRKLKKLAEGTKSDIDDEFIRIVKTLKPPFYSFLAFYFASTFLVFSGIVRSILNTVLIVWVVYQVIAALQILINYVVRKRFEEDDTQSRAAVSVISGLIKGVLWAIALLMILSNLGVNITSLVAGLGIGGIAIAMALKNILGDLFGSFAIYFDKPFVVGDFIVASGDTMGTVEKIGIKTTRIRSPQGEEIVMPNDKLTSVKIQNFKKMERRRNLTRLGVVYGTPTEKMKKIPDMIRNILEPIKSITADRIHFKEFADSTLVFEIVYYVESKEYSDFMDAQQEVNLKIKEVFDREGIEIAFPTQTIYLAKQ